nr:la-related protein 1C-like [Ipomoea batatas]
MAGRQRSMKHRSGAPGQGGFSRQPPLSPSPPPFPIFEMPYGNLIPAVMDPSMVGPRPAVGGVVHLRPNYSSPNNLPRRESSGARPHGDWTYNQGNRHNHGRRDPPYQFAPRHGGFIPSPPPSSPPFLPQAVGSMGCPIGFDVATPFMSYIPTLQGMPPPPPSMIYPIDTNLSTSLLKQIDYYFSIAPLKEGSGHGKRREKKQKKLLQQSWYCQTWTKQYYKTDHVPVIRFNISRPSRNQFLA